MDDYINNYESFTNVIIYDFTIGAGGIGDCIKYFIFTLEWCIKNKIKLYYKKNNLPIENYIKLKYYKMYIDDDAIKQLNYSSRVCIDNKEHNFIFSLKVKRPPIVIYKIVTPQMLYSTYNNESIKMKIKDVFYFTNEVKQNCKNLFPMHIINYISIHLRLGDKHLETEKLYVECKNDSRCFSDDKIHKFIQQNSSKNIFFCCDNNAYKLKLKEKYNNIIISNCNIGHSGLSNTSKKQVLDAITEFYILINSQAIIAASNSGFSEIASKFNNIKYSKLL